METAFNTMTNAQRHERKLGNAVRARRGVKWNTALKTGSAWYIPPDKNAGHRVDCWAFRCRRKGIISMVEEKAIRARFGASAN